MGSFRIGQRPVGDGEPCLLIAEMALGHDGSLGAAHAFLDAAAEAGVDAVKFQTHIAEAEGTAAEQFRVKIFPQDETRQDYWRRTAFTEPQWAGLKRHADEKRLIFLSSPFSMEAAGLLRRIGVPAWKIGSGETSNTPMLEALCDAGLPFLVSTGMSTWAEIDRAVALIRARGLPLLLFQCTNRYPCPPEHLGLNVLADLRRRYGVAVGFSDHSASVSAGIAALCHGASAIEVHVTFSRRCFGPDVAASLTFEQLAELVSGVRFLEKAAAHPVDKDAEAGELGTVRSLFTKSVTLVGPRPAGTVLGREDLSPRKPGTGIPAADMAAVVGRKLRRDVTADRPLQWEDLDDDGQT